MTVSRKMNSAHLVWVLMAALSLGNGEQRVHQPKEDLHAVESATIMLDCSYNSSQRNDYIFWYKQEGNAAPNFVLSIFMIGRGKKGDKYERFYSSINATALRAPLHINRLNRKDSAVFYCAVQPTPKHSLVFLYKNTCIHSIGYIGV
ncbi:T cell receptor alpha variable 13-1 [Stigmatopora argus]